MKVAVILCLLVAGTQASFFDDLKTALHGVGQSFTDTFHQVGEQAKVVGSQLLETAKQQGSQLASQALQSLLLGTMNALTPSSPDAGTKRELTDLVQHLSQVEGKAKEFLESKLNVMNSLLHLAVGKLQETAQGFHEKTTQEVHTQVDNVVNAHNAILDHLKDDLVHGLTNILGQALVRVPEHKRSAFTDTLAQLGHGLAAFFQPHIDALKQVVGGVGDSLKQTSSTFNSAVDPVHTQAIASSSAEIAKHGKNALNAVKDALTDILQQTLTNIQPHLHNIINHGAAALGQGVDALAGNPGATNGEESQVGS